MGILGTPLRMKHAPPANPQAQNNPPPPGPTIPQAQNNPPIAANPQMQNNPSPTGQANPQGQHHPPPPGPAIPHALNHPPGSVNPHALNNPPPAGPANLQAQNHPPLPGPPNPLQGNVLRFGQIYWHPLMNISAINHLDLPMFIPYILVRVQHAPANVQAPNNPAGGANP